jgi:hypothetical protein
MEERIGPAYLTLREVSALLRVAPRTLYTPYWKARLAPVRVGLRLLVPHTAVARILHGGTE